MSATVNKLEVAIHIGVVVLNVVLLLLHCGSLRDDEQLYRLPVIGVLKVSESETMDLNVSVKSFCTSLTTYCLYLSIKIDSQ